MEHPHHFYIGLVCHCENGGGVVVTDETNKLFHAFVGGKAGQVRDNFEQARNDLIELKRG